MQCGQQLSITLDCQLAEELYNILGKVPHLFAIAADSALERYDNRKDMDHKAIGVR